MLSEQRKNYRNWIVWIIAIQSLGLFIVGLLTIFQMIGTHDLNIYFRSSLYLMEGKLPYRDFNLEYPPLALLPFVVPRLVTLGLASNYYIYAFVFLLENIFFSTITMLLLLRVPSLRASPRLKIRALVFYTLFVLAVSPVILWRYDLFPTLLTVIALVAVLYHRPTLAGISLGLGVAAKLYPLVLLPVFTVYFFANKAYRSILHLWLGAIGAIFLSFLPFFIAAQNKIFSFLTYHKERGLQIESLPAGIISLIHKWGFINVESVAGYGSRNIISPFDNVILTLLPWLLILLYIFMLVKCWFHFREERFQSEFVKAESLVVYTLLALLIFIITNKVFSPQYMIWIIPFAALLKLRPALLMLAVCLTTYIMVSVGSFRQLDYVKIVWLNVRNILILGLSLWIFLGYLPSRNSLFRQNHLN
jgi:uncharacterized membrane protein